MLLSYEIWNNIAIRENIICLNIHHFTFISIPLLKLNINNSVFTRYKCYITWGYIYIININYFKTFMCVSSLKFKSHNFVGKWWNPQRSLTTKTMHISGFTFNIFIIFSNMFLSLELASQQLLYLNNRSNMVPQQPWI